MTRLNRRHNAKDFVLQNFYLFCFVPVHGLQRSATNPVAYDESCILVGKARQKVRICRFFCRWAFGSLLKTKDRQPRSGNVRVRCGNFGRIYELYEWCSLKWGSTLDLVCRMCFKNFLFYSHEPFSNIKLSIFFRQVSVSSIFSFVLYLLKTQLFLLIQPKASSWVGWVC